MYAYCVRWINGPTGQPICFLMRLERWETTLGVPLWTCVFMGKSICAWCVCYIYVFIDCRIAHTYICTMYTCISKECFRYLSISHIIYIIYPCAHCTYVLYIHQFGKSREQVRILRAYCRISTLLLASENVTTHYTLHTHTSTALFRRQTRATSCRIKATDGADTC